MFLWRDHWLPVPCEQFLGNVDMALSEVRSLQEQDYRDEGVVRSKVGEYSLRESNCERLD